MAVVDVLDLRVLAGATEACRLQGTSCYTDISLHLDSAHYVVTVVSRDKLIHLDDNVGLHQHQIPLTGRDGDHAEYVSAILFVCL